MNKLKDPSYDFWLWTVDGDYSLTSLSNNVTFPRISSMRLLDGYGIFLPHNNTAVPHLLANIWLSEDYLSIFNPFGVYGDQNGTGLFPDDDEDEEEEIDALSRVMNDVLSAVQR